VLLKKGDLKQTGAIGERPQGGSGFYSKPGSSGTFGTPAEIANAFVFLASDESAFAVGSEILVDGGMGTL